MKKVLFFASALFMFSSLQAQKLTVGANFLMGLPMGDYNVGQKGDQPDEVPPGFGLGGGIEANYWFGEALSVGLEVGYLGFAEKENTNSEGRIYAKSTALPILLKADYHFLDGNIRPYAGLGVGYVLIEREFRFPELGPEKTTANSDDFIMSWKQNGMMLSPRAGVLFGLSDLITLNFNIQYNMVFNKVDGDLEVNIQHFGETYTETLKDIEADPTNYLGINLGILFTLFE